jgi:hypothetical protein
VIAEGQSKREVSPKRLVVVSAAALAMLASPCAAELHASRTTLDARQVKTLRNLRPPGKWVLYTITWVPAPKVLVIAGDTAPPYLYNRLFTVRVDGSGGWRTLQGLSRRSCRRTSEFAPVALGRDRVAYTEDCINPRLPPNELKHIKAYSFRTHGVRSLFPYGLPFPSRAFALDPTGRRGVLNDGTGLQEQLRRLLPSKLSPPIALGLERVGQPAWSPDGRVIAVPAAVDVGKAEGVARSIASWRVYLGSSRLRSVRPFGKGTFEEDPALAWSPDSQLLAVAALGREQAGKLVLVRRRDGRQLTVARGHFGSVAWTCPTTLAAVRAVGDRAQGGEYIQMFDLRSAVSRLER